VLFVFRMLLDDETKLLLNAPDYVRCGLPVLLAGAGPFDTLLAFIFRFRGAGFMIIVFSLLFFAFLFGVWMGLCFYRRATVKATGNIPNVSNYSKSRTGTL
jgi:hypothetical protein